jgi:hypothetical protein
MPGFNGSGTYVRNHDWTTDAGNSVKVNASRMDTEDDGFATGLSSVVCKDGQTTTTAAIPFAVGIKINNGTTTAPGLSFINDTDCGLYLIGTNNVGLSLGDEKIVDFSTATVSCNAALAAINTAANNSCRVYNSATLLIPPATPTVLTFNSEDFDNGSMHATASDSGRITFPLAGVYLVTATVRVTVEMENQDTFSMVFKKNGAETYVGQAGFVSESSNTLTRPLTCTALVTLAANDYLELEAQTDAAATASAEYVAGVSPYFMAARLL